MYNSGQIAKDACGPCLNEKQLKKKNEEEAKEITATINYLVKSGGYDEKIAIVVGHLVTKLIYMQGPLK